MNTTPDQSGLTPGSADQAEITVPAAQLPRGATNPASPAFPDAENDTGDLRASIRRAIADPGAVVAARWPEESGPAWSARAVEQTLLAAGWRPPMPEVMHDAGETAEEAVRRLAAEVVGLRQQLSSLPDSETEWEWGCGTSLDEVFGMDEETARQYAETTGVLRKRRPAGPWVVVSE